MAADTQNGRLGVAVWGIGSHARRNILPALSRCRSLRISGPCSRDRTVLESERRTHGGKVWSDPGEMVADPSVDIVYLATPTGLHYQHGQRVLTAGKHLWCEKPLGSNLAEARRLVDAGRERDLMVAVSVGPLFHPQFSALQNALSGRQIGEITRIHGVFRFPHMEPGNFRYDPDLGGGALLDMGFYLLFLASVLADSAPVSIACSLTHEAPFRVDTAGYAELAFAGGRRAELAWGYGGNYENRLIVEGGSGRLTAEPAFSKPPNRVARLTLTTPQGDRDVPFADAHQFDRMLECFAEAVRLPDLRREHYRRALSSQQLLEFARQASRHESPLAIDTDSLFR